MRIVLIPFYFIVYFLLKYLNFCVIMNLGKNCEIYRAEKKSIVFLGLRSDGVIVTDKRANITSSNTNSFSFI